MSISLLASDPNSSFSVTYDTNQIINETLRLPLGLIPIGPQNEFNYLVGYTLGVGATAIGGPGGWFAHVEFGNTVEVLGFNVTDDAGNPLPATITSQSGTNYIVNPTPEPGGATLLVAGLTCCLARRRRRSQAIAEELRFSAGLSGPARLTPRSLTTNG